MAVTIKAKNVRRGHSIPGLDNAYVVEVGAGYGGVRIIHFHDAEGEEGMLSVQENHPITVDREDPQWVGYP